MRKPGRPSKLTDHLKAEILRRLAAGESAPTLRKEYKLSETTFRRNFSADASKVREVANTLAQAEIALEELPFSAQVSARTLADQMKRVSQNLAEAAVSGSATVLKLAGIAARKAELLQDTCTAEDVKPIAVLSAVATEASKVSMGLIQANKGRTDDPTEESKEELLREIAALLPN